VPPWPTCPSTILVAPGRRRPLRPDLRGARRRTLGPAGLTVVVVRGTWWASRSWTHADHAPLRDARRRRLDVQHATTYGWYLGRLGSSAEEAGRLAGMARSTAARRELYAAIDSCRSTRTGGPACALMNVPSRWRTRAGCHLPRRGEKAGFVTLKGTARPRMRASIYNAMPEAGVQALSDLCRLREAQRVGGAMFKILTLNNISVKGLEACPREVRDRPPRSATPTRWLVRSAKMHEMEIPRREGHRRAGRASTIRSRR